MTTRNRSGAGTTACAFFFLSALITATASAQTATVERFLVPIYESAYGAFGSVWIPELRVMNTGSAPAPIENMSDFSMFAGESAPPLLAPGASMNASLGILDLLGGTGNPGAFLLVKKEFADQFSFELRVRDISRVAERWGTFIPIVPESQARTSTVDLLGVPIDSRYRQMLRVYSFDRVTGSQIRVRIYGTSTKLLQIPTTPDSLLAEMTLPLQLAVTSSMPSYAQLADIGSLPGVAGSGYDEIRVAVDPLQQTTRIWAMVSVTSNTTQEVTIIAPNAH